MAKIKIRIDPQTGLCYIPKSIRGEGFTGDVALLHNALTVILIKPGSDLASVDRSLDLIKQDIALRRERENEIKGGSKMKTRSEAERLPTRPEEATQAGQHPIFAKYTRTWLHEVTGYSLGYLCRVATGKIALSRSFIERVCFALGEPEESLFLLSDAEGD